MAASFQTCLLSQVVHYLSSENNFLFCQTGWVSWHWNGSIECFWLYFPHHLPLGYIHLTWQKKNVSEGSDFTQSNVQVMQFLILTCIFGRHVSKKLHKTSSKKHSDIHTGSVQPVYFCWGKSNSGHSVLRSLFTQCCRFFCSQSRLFTDRTAPLCSAFDLIISNSYLFRFTIASFINSTAFATDSDVSNSST